MSDLVCPAAAELAQAYGYPSVLCGELHIHNSDADPVSPIMDGDSDRTAIGAYCCGPGVPGAVNSYTACAIWRAAKEATWRGDSELRDDLAGRNAGAGGRR